MLQQEAHDYMPTALAMTIPKLYAAEKVEDPTVWIKLFTPDSSWTWYILEHDPSERLCFGFVVGMDQELGYFSLIEMEEARGPHGLRIERDLHFKPTPLSAVRKLHEE